MKSVNYCFQQAENGIHRLYIYDDIREYGTFNWQTFRYDESKTSAKYFRDQLAAIPDTDTIELHINSNGGSVKEGVAIYNQLKQKKCRKVGYVDGVAYSIAFVILQACDTRVMGIGTTALIHEIWMEVAGNSRELRKAADDLDVLMDANRQIFLQCSNLTEDQLKEMMAAETFLTPDQCLEYGLIDEIGTYETQGTDPKEYLVSQINQLRAQLAGQMSFREALLAMHEGHQKKDGGEGQPPEPENPPEDGGLMKKLADLFGGM